MPESKSAFSVKELIGKAADSGLAKDIRGSHINYLFNPEHGANVRALGQTTYQEKISELAKVKPPRDDYHHKNLHTTNFVLGYENPTVQSEAASKYVKQTGLGTRVDVSDTIALMKTQSFGYGHVTCPMDANTHYVTEARDSYRTRNASNGSKDASNMKRYCTQAHFSLGSQGESFASTKQLYHDLHNGPSPGGLSLKTLQDLRKAHFALGDHNQEMLTQYQYSHKWIQPVPANAGKV